MTIVLLAIPFLMIISSLLIYRHNGKREFLKFDMVQFIYSFLLAPAMFVWLKSFLFFILRKELEFGLGLTELFVIDTLFSVLCIFIYAFVVIHSLTKSFNLKKYEDPLYDLFNHSEYFHLWLSHVVIYFGLMTVLTFISMVNLSLPLSIPHSKVATYAVVGMGIFSGIVAFLSVWLSDIEQANFMRIMKLLFAFFTLLHIVVYFVFDPKFSIEYGVYWFSLFGFASASGVSLFADRSERVTSWMDWFKHGEAWSFKANLFNK